jgi:O-antigen/teichoic acid export membrane protein
MSKGLREKIAFGTISGLILKIINVALNFIISVFLARTLAPEGYGVYAFILSVITLLAIPVQMGLPTLLIREVSRYEHDRQWGLLKGILIRANQMVIVLAILIGFLAVGFGLILISEQSIMKIETWVWALLLIPIIALSYLREAALQGLKHVVLGQIPEKIISPATYTVSLLICFYLLDGLTPPIAMSLYFLASGIAFMVGAIILYRKLPKEVLSSPPEFNMPLWGKSLIPLSILSGVHVINSQVDIFLLGVIATEKDVGLYRVAFSGAALVIFFLSITNSVLAPHIVRLHKSGDISKLKNIVELGAKVSFYTALPVVMVFFLYGRDILHLVYGVDYINAYIPLVILSLGQLINAYYSTTSLLLTMTGYERESLWCFVISVLSNVMLNVILIPYFSVIGAAIATALSILVWRVALTFVIKKKNVI